MIYSELRVETSNDFRFDLKLRGDITLVGGDSATGKTFLVRAIRAKNYNRNILNSGYDTDLSNVVIYDFTTGISKESLSTLSNKLIIIDNADIIVNQKLADYIKLDFNNQYLIFSRGGIDYHVTPNYRATMVRSGNIFGLKYKYSKPGWF